MIVILLIINYYIINNITNIVNNSKTDRALVIMPKVAGKGSFQVSDFGAGTSSNIGRVVKWFWATSKHNKCQLEPTLWFCQH